MACYKDIFTFFTFYAVLNTDIRPLPHAALVVVNFSHWITAVTINKMRHYLTFVYPGVLILEMPILLQVASTLLGKQNVQICDANLVLRYYT
jgi:hypothetical protein